MWMILSENTWCADVESDISLQEKNGMAAYWAEYHISMVPCIGKNRWGRGCTLLFSLDVFRLIAFIASNDMPYLHNNASRNWSTFTNKLTLHFQHGSRLTSDMGGLTVALFERGILTNSDKILIKWWRFPFKYNGLTLLLMEFQEMMMPESGGRRLFFIIPDSSELTWG